MMIFTKSKADDIEAIRTLLNKQSSEFRKAWNSYLGVLTSAESVKIIREFLEANNEEAAIQYIEDQSSSFFPAFLAIYTAGALFEIGLLTASALRNQRTTTRVNTILFDVLNNQTAREIRNAQTNYRRLLDQSQRNLIYAILSENRSNDFNARRLTKEIIDNLGLTEGQYKAVLNYRKLLESGSREALSRELRAKKFDRAVESAIKNKTPLTADQIDTMVEAYRKRYILYRTREMAATTSGAIVEAGREEGFRQLLIQTGLQPGDAVKTWNSRRDSKVRYTHGHQSLDNQTVKENETFLSVSGARLRYPRDILAPLREISNCRCFVTRKIQVEEII